MTILVVGDIHGCYAELQALLDRAGLAAGDSIIAVGDLFDRGPEPAAVLDFFRRTPGAQALMGNHERKHVRSARGELPPAASQMITRWLLGEDAYPAAVAYMAGLPRWLALPEAVIVHGFWEPGPPLEAQREDVLTGTLGGEAYLKARGWWPWYVHYPESWPLIVGHRDYSGQRQPFIYRDRVFGLDARCCYGGGLAGLLLPDFRLLVVPSRGDHWGALQRRYAARLASAAIADNQD